MFTARAQRGMEISMNVSCLETSHPLIMALSIKHQETSMPMKERYLTLHPLFLYHDAHHVQLVVNH